MLEPAQQREVVELLLVASWSLVVTDFLAKLFTNKLKCLESCQQSFIVCSFEYLLDFQPATAHSGGQDVVRS